MGDLIIDLPAEEPYEKFKCRLIDTYAVCYQARIQKLLTKLSLGDKRPSHLLQEMRSFRGTTINAEFLKELWTQRLPTQIQLILKASDSDLDGLAKLANQINNVYNTSNSIMSLSTSSSSSNNQNLDQQIAELTKRVDAFIVKGRSRSRNRNASSRFRSKSGRSSTSTAGTDTSKREFCRYHSNKSLITSRLFIFDRKNCLIFLIGDVSVVPRKNIKMNSKLHEYKLFATNGPLLVINKPLLLLFSF